MNEKKYEYEVRCYTFENEEVNGADFEEPLGGHDWRLNYKPSLKEIKKSYGKGWEYIREIVISKYDITNEDNDSNYEEEIYYINIQGEIVYNEQ